MRDRRAPGSCSAVRRQPENIWNHYSFYGYLVDDIGIGRLMIAEIRQQAPIERFARIHGCDNLPVQEALPRMPWVVYARNLDVMLERAQ